MRNARGSVARLVQKTGLDAVAGDLSRYVPDLSGSHDEIVAELQAAFLDAFKSSAPDVPIDTALRDRAAAFARERTSELIDDLEGATQDRVKELVAEAIENGDSIQQLRARIQADSAFSKSRAEDIAITETAFALGRGQRAAAAEMSQDEQEWIAEDSACETCAQNADDGWIGFNDSYSSGDDGIPSHPRCRCTVIYRTRRVHEDAAPVQVMKDVNCPKCGRWVGRGIPIGAQAYCPKDKGVRIEA